MSFALEAQRVAQLYAARLLLRQRHIFGDVCKAKDFHKRVPPESADSGSWIGSLMPVYVDDAKNPYGHMQMCHMVVDTIGKLLELADKI